MSQDFPTDDGDSASALTPLVDAGDVQSLNRLLESDRARLLRIVKFRMDQRLLRRIDPDDVLQEAFLEATRRINDYVRDPKMPFFIWLRFITMQKLMALHRHHFKAQVRDAAREISLGCQPLPGATSADLAAKLLGSETSPSHAAVRAELKLRLEEALNSMEPIDREILTLRHFEQLVNVEAAQVLGLTPAAASNRYVRAIKRLRAILEQAGNINRSG